MSSAANEVLLDDTLKHLRLPTMRKEYKECARQARETGEDYASFLLALSVRELENRRANQLRRRLHEARFPIMKTLENTDLSKWPGIDPLVVKELCSAGYVDQKHNLVLIGKLFGS